MFAADAHGSAGAFGSPFWMSSIEMASGVRMKAMWPSRGGRLIVTPPPSELGAGRVDVVDGIGEMAKVAPACVVLGVPVVGELDGRLPARLRQTRRRQGGEKHQRVASLLVVDAPRLAKPMSSKNAIVALRSVTRIIVCKYSMGSSSGFASLMASEHNAFGLEGKPPDTWTTRFGDRAAPFSRRSLGFEAARGGGLDRRSTVLAALKLAAGITSARWRFSRHAR